MNKKKTLSRVASNLVKKVDAFGIPVSLTYKKDPHLKSLLGGIVTILARIGVLAFLLIQCQTVIQKDAIIQTSQYRRDLTKDLTIYNVTSETFDFGIRLEYIFFQTQPEIQEHLDQYVSLMVSQNYYRWVIDSKTGASTFKKAKQVINLGECNDGRLGLSPNSSDYLSLRKGFKCPTDFQLQIQGSFASEIQRFMQVAVRGCNQTYLDITYNNTRKCMNTSEQYRIAQYLKMYVVMENSYFDDKDFSDNPIKKFLKPYYYTSKNNTGNYYYMLISKNDVILNDHMIFGSPTQKSFFETRVDYFVQNEITASIDPYPNAFINFFVNMDQGYSTTTRTVTTFMDALKNTGGFMSVIFVVATVVVQRFQKTIYYTQLVKSLFQYQKKQPQKKGTEITKRRSATQVDNHEKIGIGVDDSSNNEDFEARQDQYYTQTDYDPKESLFQKILGQIQLREKLYYSITKALNDSIRNIGCCKRRKNSIDTYYQRMYQNGIDKIHQELDIRYIAKEMRTLKFISNILLTKYQKFMIPYFKANLLNETAISKNNKMTNKDKVQFYLRKTVDNSTTIKLDKRIIKYIELSEEEKDKSINISSPFNHSSNTQTKFIIANSKSVVNSNRHSQSQNNNKKLTHTNIKAQIRKQLQIMPENEKQVKRHKHDDEFEKILKYLSRDLKLENLQNDYESTNKDHNQIEDNQQISNKSSTIMDGNSTRLNQIKDNQ